MKRILAVFLALVTLSSAGLLPVMAENTAENVTENAEYDMVVVRDEDFEDYCLGMIATGATYQPTSGEFKGMGVASHDGDRYIRQNAVDGKGGISVTVNSGLTGNLVSVTDNNGEPTQAIQILRTPKSRVTAAKLTLTGEQNFTTSRLVYSVDVKNSGKTGTEGDAGYTREVNNCFGSITVCGITFDFNTKKVTFAEDDAAAPVVSSEVFKWVVPENGTWFNIKLDIDAMESKLSCYIDNQLLCTKVYGGKFDEISPNLLEIAATSSGEGENAIYFDNVKLEKSSITPEQLARLRAQSAFDPLGEDVLVFFPGVSRVYSGTEIEYFSSRDAAVAPIQTEDKIYAPLRYLATRYGYTVGWDAKTAGIILEGKEGILLKSGETNYTYGGEAKSLRSPVWLSGGASYIEVHDAAELFGRKLYVSDIGLVILVANEENLPQGKWRESTVNTITSLYPEASLGFEVEGGWYTMADIAAEAKVTEDKVRQGSAKAVRADGTIQYDYIRNGVTRSTKYVKSGSYSGKWEKHHEFPTVMATNIAKDWTPYNTLSFWIYSEKATNEHITIGAMSNPEKTWAEYAAMEPTLQFYHVGFDIDFTGWQHFEIPISAFTPSSDKVVGFNKIDYLCFYSRAFDYEPSPYTVLYIDDVKLETKGAEELAQEQAKWEAELARQAEVLKPTEDFVVSVPAIFKEVSVLDYSRLLDAKKIVEKDEGNTAAAQAEIDEILKSYNITGDSYSYSDLVVTGVSNIGSEAINKNKWRYNHDDPEVITQPAAGEPIKSEAYFREARAVYGYDPKFIPQHVTTWGDEKYVLYNSRAVQVADSDGKWHMFDWSMQIQNYAEQALGLVTYRLRDTGYYNETKLRFDNDGDAYLCIMLAGTKADGTAVNQGLLCHSTDKMKTWTFYKLPRFFQKFEVLDGNNTDCLDGPPVILLHNYWDKPDKSGSFVIPEKLPDGTLHIPEEVVYADEPIICTSEHSGRGNFCITANGKLYIVYGVALASTEGQTPEALAEAKSRIPAGHQMWDLYKNELADDTDMVGVPSYIIEYDLEKKEFSEPVYLGSAGGHYHDGHNWSTISIDAEGYLHVFLIGHHFPLLYLKSSYPYDCTEWEPIEVISDGISYASMNVDKDGNVFAVTRNSNRGYCFDIVLQRKLKGGDWEEIRIFQYWKGFYQIWLTDIFMDRDTGRLYVHAKLKSHYFELFGDQFIAKNFIFPEYSHFSDDARPVGWTWDTSKTYARSGTGNGVRGEETIFISDDQGTNWRLATTEDFITKK